MRRTLSLPFFALSALALTACSAPIHLPGASKSVSLAPLTGLPGKSGELLVVKIDDTPPAHPQIGVEKADVIYIEQVEGGLTRLAAIYGSGRDLLPATIGPVRSARISDIDILAQYGHVGFAFSGAQRKMEPVIAAANVENISAEREPASMYSRDLTRQEPTNLILHPRELLQKTVDLEKRTIDSAHSMGWTFGKLPSDTSTVGAVAINSAALKWPSSRYSLTWSSALHQWRINYQGAPDLVASGAQLSTPTFIIQNVSITNSIYHDKVGGITPFSNTVGTGTGYLLRDGFALPITWNRPDPQSVTTWHFTDGRVANFAPGQIWIALTDQPPQFTYPSATK